MKWTPGAAWLLVYSVLAVVITFPLSGHLTSVVPHDLGDPLMSVAILWWNAHVMPLTERWWNGFAFFPAHGTLAFSDHRLGAGLIASPLQWLGLDVVTAYNLTWLTTFPLCAIAAHALGFTLTGRHDAAALCGLAYGFNPYRVAHLEHLELLAAFGMPAALAALHRYAATRRSSLIWVVRPRSARCDCRSATRARVSMVAERRDLTRSRPLGVGIHRKDRRHDDSCGAGTASRHLVGSSGSVGGGPLPVLSARSDPRDTSMVRRWRPRLRASSETPRRRRRSPTRASPA